MDDADRTQERMEREAELIGLGKRRPSLVPNGECHNCGELVAEGRLFCPGVDCRDDYERRQRLQQKKPA